MKASWWTKPRGGGGWLAMGGLAAGVVTWWPLAVVASGSWFVLAMRGYGRSRRAMLHVASAFPDAERDTTGNRVEGTLDGMRFVVRNGMDTLHVLVDTALPAALTIGPRAGLGRIGAEYGLTADELATLVTGDPAFDDRLYVFASDSESELAWRMGLTADARALLVELFAPHAFCLRDGWLDVVIDDADADGPRIERMIREGIALGLAMWERIGVENPIATFVEQIPREPEPGVRFVHYSWLVTGGYEVPAVLQLAARDPEPEIRAWAQSQRPSETLYR